MKASRSRLLIKMVEGRVEKYYRENCLLEQAFIKDPDQSVTNVVNAQISKIGENIVVRRFVRYQMGEGLEKKASDFAAEVASAVKK